MLRDVALCHWPSSSGGLAFRGILVPSTTLGSIRPITQHQIPNLSYQQHCCDNPKSHNTTTLWDMAVRTEVGKYQYSAGIHFFRLQAWKLTGYTERGRQK